jgi:hypothetical protein
MISTSKKLPVKKSDASAQMRRRSNRKRVPKSRRIPYGKIANQVMNDGAMALKLVSKFLNTEIHYNDVAATAAASSSTASFVLLNGISQGDTTVLRTGSSIKADGIDLAYGVYIGTVALATQQRIMVVLDKQTNGAIFTIASLLSATTVYAPAVPEGQKRFAILHDESIMLSSAGPNNIINKVRIPLNNHIEYNLGNAGTVADINTGSIYLIFFSNQAVNTAAFDYYSRFWFIDN